MADPVRIGEVLKRFPTPVPAKALSSSEIEALRAKNVAEEVERKRRILVADRESLFRQAGVDARHSSKPSEELKQHKEWISMVDRAWTLLETGAPILAFLGDRGNGKTQASVAMIRRAAHNLKSAQYLRCRQVGMIVRAAYRADSESSEDAALRTLVKPWLLVLDECQERFDTSHELQTLTLLLDMRYGACKPTVLIANCSEEAFKDLMGAAVIDRMKEGGGALMFTWDSFRFRAATRA